MSHAAGGIERLLSSIPDHWTRSRVRYVCRVETGSRDTVEASDDGDYPFFVRSPHVERIETYSYDTEAVLTAGDGDVGKVFHHYTGKFDAHQRVYVFKDFRDVLGRFFYYWFSNEFHHVTDQGTAESTVASLRRPMIVNFPVPVPPLDEQRAISDFLDRETAQIDAMVDAQERLVSLLEERRSALLTHVLFPGLQDIRSLEEDAVPMRYLVQSINQGWSPECESHPGTEDEWSVLKLGSVNHGVFVPAENKRLPSDLEPRPDITVRQGDVVMSRANTRQLVGSAAVVPRDYPRLMLSDLLYRIRVKHSLVQPEYVASVLGSGPLRSEVELRAKGTSHSMQKISRSDILELRLPVPSLEEQRRRQEVVREGAGRTEAMILKARESIALMKERRAALISAAVTGRIDVRTGIEQVERDLEEARA